MASKVDFVQIEVFFIRFIDVFDDKIVNIIEFDLLV
jgi:hypothetical protein